MPMVDDCLNTNLPGMYSANQNFYNSNGQFYSVLMVYVTCACMTNPKTCPLWKIILKTYPERTPESELTSNSKFATKLLRA